MKSILTAFALTLSVIAFAQSSEHQFGLTIGGGSQKYYGDLGNGFGTNNLCWYGQVSGGVRYYVNSSFDAGMNVAIGDYGYHQRESDAEGTELKDRCQGCFDRLQLDNLSSRMTAVSMAGYYKFANGYLLKETSLLKPYVFVGGSFNHLVDRMKMDCVDAGNYTALNAGAGVRVNFCDRFHVGYNATFGYFTTDQVDYKHGGGNDMYVQYSLNLGIDLF